MRLFHFTVFIHCASQSVLIILSGDIVVNISPSDHK